MEMSLQSFDSRNAKGEYDLSNAADLYHTMWDKMQELEPDERTNERFLVNLRDAIQRSSLKIGERMDEEVAKMRLTEEYKNYEEKDVYLVYLDEGSAKARRFNEQDGKVSTKQSIRSGSNQRGRRNSDSDRAQLNQALEGENYCEVCGPPTHRHRDCGVQ